MRLGGPVFEEYADPQGWVEAVRRLGYSAAYCPKLEGHGDDAIQAYVSAAEEADIVIAEVGAWSNPISADEEERRKALTLCKARLELADRVGARCCVNISGSRGERWDGPHPANLTRETFELVVESVREVIDAVSPERSYYALETMPWMYPDSVQSYLDLIEAVDRERFAVHFDPVNLVCSPQRYYANNELIRDFCARLGPHIKSCHAKDIALADKLTVHLDEVRPGLGGLDYAVYLKELDGLDPETPLMLEHLSAAEEYVKAAEHIRSVAAEAGVEMR